MATEDLKQILKEGVTLDTDNVTQLTEMVEQLVLGERVKLTEAKQAEIEALNEKHAKDLEDAVVMANARIDEAIDVAVEKFITESETRFVQTDEHARMQKLFESVKAVFEENAFALNENAVAEKAIAQLAEHREDYDALFERHMALKDEHAALGQELETAKRAIIFEKATAELTDTQRERVGSLVENVEFDSTDEFVTGLKLIVEMESKKEAATVETEKTEDLQETENVTTPAAKPAAKTAPAKLHEMTAEERMSRYRA
jgi:hypothetical protein